MHRTEPSTRRFEDLVAQIVQRLRQSPAGRFVPHRMPHRASDSTAAAERRPAHACRGPASYRDAYRCPATTWGADDGWTPPVTSDAAAAMQRNALAATNPTASPSTGASATMPFRIFDPT